MEISGPYLERTFRERRTNQKRANESTASGNWEGRSSTSLTPTTIWAHPVLDKPISGCVRRSCWHRRTVIVRIAVETLIE